MKHVKNFAHKEYNAKNKIQQYKNISSNSANLIIVKEKTIEEIWMQKFFVLLFKKLEKKDVWIKNWALRYLILKLQSELNDLQKKIKDRKIIKKIELINDWLDDFWQTKDLDFEDILEYLENNLKLDWKYNLLTTIEKILMPLKLIFLSDDEFKQADNFVKENNKKSITQKFFWNIDFENISLVNLDLFKMFNYSTEIIYSKVDKIYDFEEKLKELKLKEYDSQKNIKSLITKNNKLLNQILKQEDIIEKKDSKIESLKKQIQDEKEIFNNKLLSIVWYEVQKNKNNINKEINKEQFEENQVLEELLQVESQKNNVLLQENEEIKKLLFILQEENKNLKQKDILNDKKDFLRNIENNIENSSVDEIIKYFYIKNYNQEIVSNIIINIVKDLKQTIWWKNVTTTDKANDWKWSWHYSNFAVCPLLERVKNLYIPKKESEFIANMSNFNWNDVFLWVENNTNNKLLHLEKLLKNDYEKRWIVSSIKFLSDNLILINFNWLDLSALKLAIDNFLENDLKKYEKKLQEILKNYLKK